MTGGVLKFLLVFAWAGLASGVGFDTGQISECGRYFHYLKSEIEFSANRLFEDDEKQVYAQSWRDEHPHFYHKVMELFQQYPTFAELLPDQIEMGTPLSELMERTRFARNHVAQELRRLVQKYRESLPNIYETEVAEKVDDLIRCINQAANRLEIYSPGEAARRKLDHYWFNRVEYDQYREYLDPIADEVFTGKPSQLHALARIGVRLNSFWGELRAASVVPNLMATNMHLQEADRWLGLPSADVKKLPKQLSQKEIDVVWRISPARQNPRDQTFGWGEVKTYFQPLDAGEHYRHTWEKLTHSITSGRLAAKLLELKVKHHIFLTNGLTPAAVQRLTAMGYSEIHGPIMEPGSR